MPGLTVTEMFQGIMVFKVNGRVFMLSVMMKSEE
jgi:hypothetical protein